MQPDILLDKDRNGRHPDSVSKEEYEAAGHSLDTAMKTIRKFCLSCVGDQPSEVRLCTATSCPLWPLRMGKYPNAR